MKALKKDKAKAAPKKTTKAAAKPALKAVKPHPKNNRKAT